MDLGYIIVGISFPNARFAREINFCKTPKVHYL